MKLFELFEETMPSMFVTVDRNLVEIQLSWSADEEPLYTLFIDGKFKGKIIERDGKYLVDDMKYSDINEAIATIVKKGQRELYYTHRRTF